jgi:uncharacterized protein (TIGR02996 family)
MLTDRDAFLRAIIADPADDLPRLAFADWLDEHGEPERAELIRLGCWYATAPDIGEDGFPEYGHGGDGGCDVCRPIHRLVELVEADARRLPYLGAPEADWVAQVGHDEYPGCVCLVRRRCDAPIAVSRRGFVARVSLPLAALTDDVARRLGETCPLDGGVRLTDVTPFRFSATLGFGLSATPGFGLHDRDAGYRNDGDLVSGPIFRHVERIIEAMPKKSYPPHVDIGQAIFDSVKQAFAVLDRAAADHCRALAGFGPLPAPATAATA